MENYLVFSAKQATTLGSYLFKKRENIIKNMAIYGELILLSTFMCKCWQVATRYILI